MRTLGRQDVLVYLLRDRGEPLPDELATWLAPEEAARLARLRVESVRRELVLGRGLLRAVLSRHAPVAPPAWRFEAGPHGRPELAGPDGAPPLRFNLSHTRGLLAVAVTLGRDVGVDVEATSRDVHDDALARRFFAPPEAADVTSRAGDDRRARFFAYWTFKEAYIKARGLGLVLPLEHFWIQLEARPVAIAFSAELDDDPASWHLERHELGFAHAVAVAARRTAGAALAVHFEEVPGPGVLARGW